MGTTYKNRKILFLVGRFFTLIRVYLIKPTYKEHRTQNLVGRLRGSDDRNQQKPAYKNPKITILVGRFSFQAILNIKELPLNIRTVLIKQFKQ